MSRGYYCSSLHRVKLPTFKMPPKTSRRGAQNQAGRAHGRARGRGRSRGRGRRGSARSDRVPVINLDGASGSEESEEEEIEDSAVDKNDIYLNISSPVRSRDYLASSSLFSCEESDDDDDFILEVISKSQKKGNYKKDSATPPKKPRQKRTPKSASKSLTKNKDIGNTDQAVNETKDSRTGGSDDDDGDNSQFLINPDRSGGVESDDESDDFDPFATSYGANMNLARSAAEIEDLELQKEVELQKQKELLEKERLQKIKDEKKEEEELIVLDEAEKNDLIVLNDVEENNGWKKRNTRQSAKQAATEPDNEVIQTGHSLKKISRKTHAALNHFNMINHRLENDSFNMSFSSDILEVEEVDDDKDVTLRLKQGREYFKHTMKKHQTFSVLFQEMAEKHKVSVSQIFLTLNNEYLDPEKTPEDLGITMCDVIELGVMSAEEDAKDPTTSIDANNVSFKVQTADRKGSITVTINQYDKMQVLMDKYAKEKGVDVSELLFRFDGEALEPSETPISLDLEGGECIDVYPKK